MSLPRPCKTPGCINKIYTKEGIKYKKLYCDECIKKIRNENFLKMMSFRNERRKIYKI